MPLLTFHGIDKAFGARDLFANLSGSLEKGDRIGLVGANGIGKSTFLRVLLGIEEKDGGDVVAARGVRIGYLAQSSPDDDAEQANKTLREFLLPAFAHLQKIEQELTELSQQFTHDHNPDLLAIYEQRQHEFEHLGGYDYENRLDQVTRGLGFTTGQEATRWGQLSGGQQTRARLARLLLESPDVLLLDEPTNHLDIQAVEWLEGWLTNSSETFLLVSHDRFFLDRVVNRVWELGPAQLETYRGNYSSYLQQREARWEQRRLYYEIEKARMQKELEYIRRNIAGQNTNQAKGKLRRLSRLVEAAEALGIEALQGKKWSKIALEMDGVGGRLSNVEELSGRIAALRDPLVHASQIRLRLQTKLRAGDQVLQVRDLTVGYPSEPLLTLPQITLPRGSFVGIVGSNGSGKSSLLKTLMGILPPLQGEYEWGASLQVGYFSQNHAQLQPESTVFATIQAANPALMDGEIRDYLAQFLFPNDAVYKQVKMLSGGERGRLALATLALGKANVLLLDEPTNHLDILAQEVLQSVLEQFNGTVLLVSHDRYLLDRLATQIWAVEDRYLRVYDGGYAAYTTRVTVDNGARDSAKGQTNQPSRTVNTQQRTEKKLAQQRAEKAAQLESKIAQLEEELQTLTRAIEAAGLQQDNDQMLAISTRYQERQDQLAAALQEWEEVAA